MIKSQKNIFELDSYRDIVRAQVDAQKGQRGYLTRLAAAIQCHPSFLSQVLHQSVHLTPDQAASMAEFWNLADDEARYFVDLVMFERSGHPALKRQMKSRLDELRHKRLSISARLKHEKSMSIEAQAYYYSAWYIAAIHVLLSIPRLQTTTVLAQSLRLDLELVNKTLKRLNELNLAKQEQGLWKQTETRVHLPDSSELTSANHSHWRARGLLSVQERASTDVHYTAVFTLSKKDRDRVRKILVDAIEATRQVIGPSPEEEGAVITVDMFGI